MEVILFTHNSSNNAPCRKFIAISLTEILTSLVLRTITRIMEFMASQSNHSALVLRMQAMKP